MTEYTLSVVQLCPDAYCDIANSIAEAAGYGSDNLSVKLRHTDGSTWWGCHAWWIPEALEVAMQPPEGVPEAWVTALSNVVTSVREGGDPYQHWVEALAENGLTIAEAIE